MNINVYNLVTRVVEELKYNPDAITVEEGKLINGAMQIGYSKLNSEIRVFFDWMIENKLDDSKYKEHMENIKGRKVETLSLENLFTMLTAIYRSEKFVNGSIYNVFKSGVLLRIFYRIQDLIKNDPISIEKVKESFELNKNLDRTISNINNVISSIDKPKENEFDFRIKKILYGGDLHLGMTVSEEYYISGKTYEDKRHKVSLKLAKSVVSSENFDSKDTTYIETQTSFLTNDNDWETICNILNKVKTDTTYTSSKHNVVQLRHYIIVIDNKEYDIAGDDVIYNGLFNATIKLNKYIELMNEYTNKLISI